MQDLKAGLRGRLISGGLGAISIPLGLEFVPSPWKPALFVVSIAVIVLATLWPFFTQHIFWRFSLARPTSSAGPAPATPAMPVSGKPSPEGISTGHSKVLDAIAEREHAEAALKTIERFRNVLRRSSEECFRHFQNFQRDSVHDADRSVAQEQLDGHLTRISDEVGQLLARPVHMDEHPSLKNRPPKPVPDEPADLNDADRAMYRWYFHQVRTVERILEEAERELEGTLRRQKAVIAGHKGGPRQQ